jgi:hypothetical protein
MRSSRKRGPIRWTPSGRPSTDPTGTTAAGIPISGTAVCTRCAVIVRSMLSALSVSKPMAKGGSVLTGVRTMG